MGENMKRNIMPKNHNNLLIANTIVGLGLIASPFIVSMFYNFNIVSHAAPTRLKENLILWLLIPLGIAYLLIGFNSNKSSKNMLNRRKYMLQKNYTIGEIIDIERVKEEGSKISEYVLVVKFIDIISGESKVIKSHEYIERLPYILANNQCKVYIDTQFETYYIDGLNFRESSKDSIITLPEENTKSNFYFNYFLSIFFRNSSTIFALLLIFCFVYGNYIG